MMFIADPPLLSDASGTPVVIRRGTDARAAELADGARRRSRTAAVAEAIVAYPTALVWTPPNATASTNGATFLA
jgi:hypothetical protein